MWTNITDAPRPTATGSNLRAPPFTSGAGVSSTGNRGDFRSSIFISAVVLMLCSTLAVMLRLVRSWQQQRRFEVHDLFIVIAVVCAAVMSSGCAHLTTDGLGEHDYDGHTATNASFQKSVIFINCFYFSCNLFVKLGLLQMYRKFTRQLWGLALIYFMEAASVLFWLGSILATIFQCLPLSAVWDRSVEDAWCIDIISFYHANAGIMIGMDTILYFIPIIFTWHLRLCRAQKIGLLVLFSLGFLVVTSSCVRFWIVYEITANGDMSFNYGRSLFASAIENHLAIIIACAPAVKSVIASALYPTVKHALESSKEKFTKLRSSSSGSVPSTPFSAHFQLPTTTRPSSSSVAKTSKASSLPSLGSLFATGGHSRPNTQATGTRSVLDGGDIELGFHDRTCEFVPTMTTTITAGGALPRPPSSKNMVYITREITVTEEFLTRPSTIAGDQDEATSRASTESSQNKALTTLSSIDVTKVTMGSVMESKDSIDEKPGVARKDFVGVEQI